MKKDTLIKTALSVKRMAGAALGAAKKFRALDSTARLSQKGSKTLGQLKTFTGGAIKAFKK